MRKIIQSLLLLSAVTFTVEIGAAEITFQSGLSDYDGCEDTYIRSQRPNENYGNENKIGSKYEYCAA